MESDLWPNTVSLVFLTPYWGLCTCSFFYLVGVFSQIFSICGIHG